MSKKENNQNRNKTKEDVICEKRFWFKIFSANKRRKSRRLNKVFVTRANRFDVQQENILTRENIFCRVEKEANNLSAGFPVKSQASI